MLGLALIFAAPNFAHADLDATSRYAASRMETRIDPDLHATGFNQKRWKLKTGFESRNEDKDDGFASLLLAEAELEFTFSPWLRLEASPYVAYYSSRVQERFDDDTYSSRLGLTYGHLTIEPLQGLFLKAGAIAQSHLNNSQMISSFRSFPGGMVEYKSPVLGLVSVGGRYQYLIPTSSSMNSERENEESLPTFQTASLFANLAQPQWTLGMQAGIYEWANLPAKVASQSTRAGNTPANELLDAEARFRYQYKGWFADIEGLYTFDNGFGMGGAFKRFSNTEAPSNMADSQRAGLTLVQDFGSFSAQIEGGSFFTEADATVARYTSSSFGNTNRTGYYLEGKVDIKPYKFYLVSSYTQANELNNGPSQDDANNFSFMVESYEFRF